MSPVPLQWQVSPVPEIPAEFIKEVQQYTPTDSGYAARLLWQRGIRDIEQIAGFLNPDLYTPASPFEFGQEMKWAVARLQQALKNGEKLCIWGDFDADGITSTSVLWKGLGQFFPQEDQLSYYIPNRLTESHGLNEAGIERLAASGVSLIVTCDTGSTNLAEIEQAKRLGIDVIVTDHHTLPEERPPVVAIINPRYFASHHPLFHLSGVAVAYKLVEGLYSTLPDIPSQPLEELLDLVAIGLIADLVQLSGDCRYLAQRGIEKLRKQLSNPTRPGVAKLLELCRRTGDRPTDISFGLGPRINAVSRIQGDASFCVELLTSRNASRCEELALETELANTRRKELQKDVTQQVKARLASIDLSTTSVIVLEDSQWQGGVLGLVASQIASEYGRPTILLSTSPSDSDSIALARGSARSVNNIDLYELVQSQAHLLHRFGGHPYAAGMSLPIENVPIFREAINQQLRQQNFNVALQGSVVEPDLVVTVKDLGKELFKELQLLEPCGMGNPIPRLLIKNCQFKQVRNKNIQDFRQRTVKYIKTTFLIKDNSTSRLFPGIWWGHYSDEIPKNESCDAIVELDYNTYKDPSKGQYEVRLVAVRPNIEDTSWSHSQFPCDFILDWRQESHPEEITEEVVPVTDCPVEWNTLQLGLRSAIASHRKLALAYSSPDNPEYQRIWEQLIGIAKYLHRTQQEATLTQVSEKLGISDRALQIGLKAISSLGFEVTTPSNQSLQIQWNSPPAEDGEKQKDLFLAALREESFLREYFYQVPVTTLEGILKTSGVQPVNEE